MPRRTPALKTDQSGPAHGLAAGPVPLEQLHPAPWNPRIIKDERFQNPLRSIQSDPDFIWRRPILATADGTIYAGKLAGRSTVDCFAQS